MSRQTLLILVGFLAFSVIYWLIPDNNRFSIQLNDTAEKPTWPVISLRTDGNSRHIIVHDPTPWTFVLLETENGTYHPQKHGSQTADGIWRWEWTIEETEQINDFSLFHSCATGCKVWSAVHTSKTTATPPQKLLVPTKLGLVFANENRDWHGKRGWDVEITYATLAEDTFWGIDDLSRRVRSATANGLQVLIRVEYAQGQNLPPANDHVALDTYLTYLQRLAHDERLAGAYGFIIGSNFNTAGANTLSPQKRVTPEWYARIFNGYGVASDHHDNAIEVVRASNSHMRVLVGPVTPWSEDQSGTFPHEIDAPWLNYMNTMVTYINEAALEKAMAGFGNPAPDGFAVQVFGRVSDLENTPAQEPYFDLHTPAWGSAQMGFRIYQDWLNIINQYPATRGTPVYINATNTFESNTNATPADNYPQGWLTNALTVIQNEPQIYALCWFMDGFAHDDQWAMFSLTTPRGLLIDAAEEFDTLLQQ